MKYRAEIDGLRAVAVIPVILFHAGFDALSGGFIGVDVFFVISGFLISTIIIEDIEKRRFSLLNFYERRIRRILPVLFFIMLICIPFAWMWMLPDPLENFGQSLVATTLSANNILLSITSGYWELASEFKPLLHTWSLGVEEQFYIFFPIFLMLFWWLGKFTLVLLIFLIAMISLFLAELGVDGEWEGTFFLLHTRAWELLSGTVVAFLVHKYGVRNNNLYSAVGLALIIYSMITFDETTPTPSLFTLVPITGVVLLILFAGKNTFVSKILGLKLLVGIGLISYSAYLWHQPLFAFSRIYSVEEPSQLQNVALIVATFIFSYFTWRYIEKPFRRKDFVSQKVVASLVIACSIITLSFGYAAHVTHGFVGRVFDNNVIAADMYISYNERNFIYKRDFFKKSENINILVLGDSFGRDFVNVLHETYDVDTFNLVYRDDFYSCNLLKSSVGLELLSTANIVVFAYDFYAIEDSTCNRDVISFTEERGASTFFIGSKHFGFNHNWIARTDISNRAFLRNPVMLEIINEDKSASSFIPSKNYISIMKHLTNDDGVLITDGFGRLISGDRRHLTKYGAILIGREIISNSLLDGLVTPTNNKQ